VKRAVGAVKPVHCDLPGIYVPSGLAPLPIDEDRLRRRAYESGEYDYDFDFGN
jgi:hypothetical protein